MSQTLKLVNYSEKAVAVIGDTKPVKDTLKNLGGKFNPHLKCGAGWIFSKKKVNDIDAALTFAPNNYMIPLESAVVSKNNHTPASIRAGFRKAQGLDVPQFEAVAVTEEEYQEWLVQRNHEEGGQNA